MPTLAELRARSNGATQSLPTRSLEVCTDQSAMARIIQLATEKDDLETAHQRALAEAGYDPDASAGDAKPKRTGQKRPMPPARLAEIDAEVERLYDQMRDSQGTLWMQARDGGDWQRWKDEHPAMPQGHVETVRANGDHVKGEPVYDPRDFVIARSGLPLGYFNVNAVVTDLGRWVTRWNDELINEGDWNGWLFRQIAPGDLREAAVEVVRMHEERVLVRPKFSTDQSATATDETA